ncbi:protein Lines homolog 1 isoform X2 [Ascaphus truei]
MLIAKAESPRTEPSARCQYTQVARLLQQAGVEVTIILLCRAPDKVLSHVAAKCLSCLVLFQLRCENEVNIPWLEFCRKTLRESPGGGGALIPCVTSLIAVCKGILRDEDAQRADTLLKLLGPLDPVFEGLCGSVHLSATPSPDPESSSHVSCLLDLWEVLAALRMKLRGCQRGVSLTLPLALVSSHVHYFVKKQFIQLLKKCLLRKCGEDFLRSPPAPRSPLWDPLLEQDMAALAGSLLSAVDQGWLLQVPVSDKICGFGGANDTSESGADQVILGAASLSLLRALETRVLAATPSKATDVTTYLGQLLVFLKRPLGSRAPYHPCEWVSLIFIEQDDDMLEVAKSLLKIYAQCHSLWPPPPAPGSPGDEADIWSGPSHQNGCDPHCIFLLLLCNLAFDASVLLDFLISSETCFLEYFVRYLKLLREDWPRFCLTCTLFDKSASQRVATSAGLCMSAPQGHVGCETRVSGDHSSGLPHPRASISPACNPPGPVTGENAKHLAPCHPSSSCHCASPLGALQHLAAYDSSEDSDSEGAEEERPAPPPETPVTAQLQGGDGTDKEVRCPRFDTRPACAETADAAASFPGVRRQSARCLEQLQKAICRLQRRNLFPYNPSALLRLLSRVKTLHGDAH